MAGCLRVGGVAGRWSSHFECSLSTQNHHFIIFHHHSKWKTSSSSKIVPKPLSPGQHFSLLCDAIFLCAIGNRGYSPVDWVWEIIHQYTEGPSLSDCFTSDVDASKRGISYTLLLRTSKNHNFGVVLDYNLYK